jgi:protein-tyrosine phosphatase
LRDLGGLPTNEGLRTRTGRLFRGASLHRLEADESTAVASLGLRSAFDLRTTAEVGARTYRQDAVALHHFPVFELSPEFEEPIEDVAVKLAETYIWMLDEGGAAISGILRMLEDPAGYPAIIYCAAGKDRTGVICAIVLHLLGVDREEIIADYALSDAPAQALREWRARLAPELRDPVPAAVYRAPAAAMRLFFVMVEDRFGSIEAYLETIDVPVETTRRALRANLVEGSPT